MLYLAFGIGPSELVPILIIVLVLFGAKKLPELAKAMGSSINQFKKGLSETEEAQEQLAEGESSAAKQDGAEGRDAQPEGAQGARAVVDEEKTRVP